MSTRKQTEEALQESERFLQSVFDAIQDGISALDCDLNIIRVNQWIERMYATRKPLVGRKCYVVYQQRQSACPWCPSIRTLETGDTHSEIVPYPSEHSPSRWLELSTFPLKRADDTVVGVIEHVKDITERVQAEREIQQLFRIVEQGKRDWEATFDAMQDAIMLVSRDHLIVRVNRAFANLVQKSFRQIVGQMYDGILEGMLCPERTCPLKQMMESGQPATCTHEYLGRVFEVQATPVPEDEASEGVLEGPGRVEGAIYVMRDITERKWAEEEIRRQAEELATALAQLQELDRLKSEFMQNVSHELRTPLALIWGYAELLTDGTLGELDPEQRGPIESITWHTRRLIDLVEDIVLILAKETRVPDQEPVALERLVRAAVRDFQLIAEQAQLALRAEIVPDLPPVHGTPAYLRRVLDNLINNAIKFTPAGGSVTVRLWQQEDTHQSSADIVLQVADSGIGIAADQQAHIFDRFYQIDGSARRKYGGVGLGLALVKEIVEAHNGQVVVDSKEGKGSTFTITLPICDKG
jgi:PAS domain S-box-containing protein